ncbi:MAG: ComEC/Rec2 family competence protein [Maribacter sp.]|uniref:ComEC/Rec2 family competence protein n=1 Tax=Maribacter sp. TaxID=1897614 RepID=UPI003C7645F1
MKLLDFIPIKLTLLLVLGILIGYSFNTGIRVPLLLTLVSLLTLGILHFKQKKARGITFGIMAACTTLFLGILIVALAQPKNAIDHYSHFKSNGPDTWELKIIEVLKPTSFNQRFIAEVTYYQQRKASGRIIVNLATDSIQEKLQVDDELIAYSTLEMVHPALNPHQFNYKNYLEKLGVYNQLHLNRHDFILYTHPTRTLRGYAARLRDKIISRMKQANFGEDEFGIIQALFLGQRDDISEATYTAYKNAGAVHILAVSGLHIGILLIFLEFLLRPLEFLPKGKVLKLTVIVLLLWGFAFLAGLSASVVRAVTMFSFVAYALYLNRPSNTFNILALSMFFILLVFNPMLLFNVGFQMSYAAVFAIVWLYPLLQKFWSPKPWLVKKIWQLLSVSLAAQIGVLPIGLYYFHQFPGLFFVSNLLIVPFLGLILGVGILVIALVLLNLAPDSLIALFDTLIGSMNAIIDWIAQQEAFIFQNIPFDSVQMVITYALLISLIWMLPKPTFKSVTLVLVSMISLQIWSLHKQRQTHDKEQLWVAHQTKNSILMHQSGAHLTIYSTDSSASTRIIDDYVINENIATVMYRPLGNAFNMDEKKLLIIDSLAVFPELEAQPDIVLLTQSPKLNLARVIDSLRPRALIADGSNYRSYVKRWAATCDQKKIPFHYTGEQGAFVMTLN